MACDWELDLTQWGDTPYAGMDVARCIVEGEHEMVPARTIGQSYFPAEPRHDTGIPQRHYKGADPPDETLVFFNYSVGSRRRR
jgi:hypothetical protein